MNKKDPASKTGLTKAQLLLENEALQSRLEEAEEALYAIYHGKVDAVVVHDERGDHVFTLQGADYTYRRLIEEMNEGAANLSTDGTILYANKRLTEMLGESVGSVLGCPLRDFVKQKDGIVLNAMLRKAAAEPVKGELTLKTGSGKSVPVLFSLSALQVEEILILCAVFSDLTGQKMSEKVLLESEEKYKKLVLTMHDALVLFDPVTCQIIETNAAFEKLYGYTKDDLSKLNIYDISAEPELSRDAVTKIVRNGSDGAPIRYHRKKNGEIFAVEASGSSFALQGRTVVCTVFRDISERLKAEQTHMESEEKYSTLVSAMTDAVLLFDPETCMIMDANAAAEKLYGYPKEDLLKLNIYELSAEPELSRETTNSVITNGSARVPIRRLKKKDGTIFSVEVNAVAFDFKGKRIICTVSRDISERVKGEQKLLDSEEKYRKLVTAMTDAVVLYDPATSRILDANPALEKLYGYTRDELLKLSIYDISAEPDRSRETIKKIVRNGSANTPLRYNKKKNGEIFPVEITATSFIYQGRLVVCTVNRDISERVKAEQALKESEEKYRLLVSTMTDAVMLFDPATSRILDANPACEKLYGYTREELLKINIFKLSAEPEMSKGNTQKVLRNGYSKTDIRYHRKKNGEKFPIEGAASSFLLNGRQVIYTVNRDINERVNAEQALKESEEKYRMLVSTLPDAVLLVDPVTFKILDVNPSCEQLYGYSRNEFLKKSVYDISAEPDKTKDTMIRLSKKGHEWTGLRYHRKKSGEVFAIEAAATVFRIQGKKLVCAVNRDITERLNAEAALKNAHEQLRIFSERYQTLAEEEKACVARDIHDELGQSLTAFKIDLFWLKKNFPGESDSYRLKLKSMASTIDQITKIVQNISTKLRPQMLDELGLMAAIDWQVKEFQKRSGLVCILSLDYQCQVSDRDLSTVIFRIFQELLANVSRHAKATRVTASLHIKNKLLVLKVKDNGIGISAEEISSPKSLGLIGIRERLYRWKGNIKITGIKNRGTTVAISVPLDSIKR